MSKILDVKGDGKVDKKDLKDMVNNAEFHSLITFSLLTLFVAGVLFIKTYLESDFTIIDLSPFYNAIYIVIAPLVFAYLRAVFNKKSAVILSETDKRIAELNTTIEKQQQYINRCEVALTIYQTWMDTWNQPVTQFFQEKHINVNIPNLRVPLPTFMNAPRPSPFPLPDQPKPDEVKK